MKTRKFSLKQKLLVLLLLCGSVYVVLRYISPDIILVNQTDKIIYTYTVQARVNAGDLSDEEIIQIKNIWSTQAGKKIRLPIFLLTLFTQQEMDFGVGWRIGSRVDSEGKSGGKLFILDRHQGACRMSIEIQEGSYKVIPEDQLYCYKKLKMPEK